MTTLRSPNGNCVAALQPAPGDLFTVTMLSGKIVFIRSADDYEQSLRLAEAFADGVTPPAGRPFTVKVLGMSLGEVLAFQGIDRDEFAKGLSASDAEIRTMAERECRELLRRSGDAAVREAALQTLSDIGVLRS